MNTHFYYLYFTKENKSNKKVAEYCYDYNALLFNFLMVFLT